ncbi:hypothetical protein E2P30_01100 [Candidatus Bathyarchaeota archaeon]|nr:hypothetical protein E2P30_01100 [Candidatus Bathyarchaeota archaeon]
MELNWNGEALIATLLFRLLFGGYVIGMDQYFFNDVESAWTVLLIYGLIGIFATLFLFGKRIGLICVMGLEAVFITLQSIFIIVSLGQIADAGLHDPLSNWWATLLMYAFSVLTLTFSIRIYRES